MLNGTRLGLPPVSIDLFRYPSTSMPCFTVDCWAMGLGIFHVQFPWIQSGLHAYWPLANHGISSIILWNKKYDPATRTTTGSRKRCLGRIRMQIYFSYGEFALDVG
jgi:hypothetical protein